MKYLLAAMALLCSSLVVFGQTLNMTGKVVDAETQAPLLFANLTVKGYALGTATDENGAFQLAIQPTYADDSLVLSMVGYTNKTIAIRDLQKRTYPTTFALTPTSFEFVAVEVGAPMVLHNIQFEFNKHKLLPPSYPELSKLFNYLIKNPAYNIEIIGHTDNVGTDTYNLALSEARAGAVLTWLEEAGIPPSRMIARGYGEQYPIATNDTELGREQNRRVEFRVFDHDLTDLPPYQVNTSALSEPDAGLPSPTIRPDTTRQRPPVVVIQPLTNDSPPQDIGTPKGITPTRPDTATAILPSGQAQARLYAATLSRQFNNSNVAGLMSIIGSDGQTLAEAASGMAHYTYQQPLTTAHSLHLGAWAEQFTAVLLLRLADAQRLDLNAPLSTFFPDFPDAAIRERVTVWQLLTHTSGLRDSENGAMNQLNERQKWQTFEALSAAGRQDPGTHHPAAVNYYLAAAIAEEITQLDFHELLKRELFLPLGMTHTAPLDLTSLDSLRARHYVRDGATLAQLPLHDGLFTPGHNGMASTLADLTRWNNALRSQQLLSEAGMERLMRPFQAGKTLMGDIGPSGQLTHFSAEQGTEVGWVYAPHSTTILLSNVQGIDLTPLLPLPQ